MLSLSTGNNEYKEYKAPGLYVQGKLRGRQFSAEGTTQHFQDLVQTSMAPLGGRGGVVIAIPLPADPHGKMAAGPQHQS